MTKLKSHPYLLFLSIVSFVAGIWLVVDNPSDIINLIHFIIGGGLVFLGLIKLMTNDKKYIYEGMINIVLGTCLILFHNWIITIVLGALFIVFPVIRIWRSDFKKNAIKNELPVLIIGLVIAFSGDLFAFIIARVFGLLLILFALYLFASIFIDKMSLVRYFYYDNDEEKRVKRKNVIDIIYEERDSNEK